MMSQGNLMRYLVARCLRSMSDPKGMSPNIKCGTAKLALMIAALTAASLAVAPFASAASLPNFGPNVTIFDPSMPLSQIQAAVDAIASQQVSNQFGTQRYALLFKPGTYGSVATPLNFQVGYYTAVAGLGQSPNDVVINGSIDVYNQCFSGSCIALDNFWRSLSNLTINVANPNGCYTASSGPCRRPERLPLGGSG